MAIKGTTASEKLNGTVGADTFDSQGGADTIDGGAGADTAVFWGSASDFSVTSGNGVAIVYGDSGYYAAPTLLLNVETLQFTDRSVKVDAASAPLNLIRDSSSSYYGQKLTGTAGSDVIDSNGGSDTIDGGAGSDTLVLFEDSSNFNVVTLAGLTQVTGTGYDSYSYGYRYYQDTLQLENVEKIQFADKVVDLTVATDTVKSGSSQAETLNGTAGVDTFDSQGGADTIDGGAGTDTAVFWGSASDFSVTSGNGVAIVYGNSGYYAAPTLLLNVETLQFTDRSVKVDAASAPLNLIRDSSSSYYGQKLTGTAGSDVIDSNGGSDTIDGGAGSDTLVLFEDSSNFNVVTLAGLTQVTGTGYDSYSYGYRYYQDTLQLENVEKIQFADKVVSLVPEPDWTLAGATLQVSERSAANTALGTVQASGAEGLDLSYSIASGNTDVDGDGRAAFAIDAKTGVLTVLDAGDLDYAKLKTFSLEVSATDGSTTDTATIAVNVANINDQPTGKVTITGTATLGQILTAANTLADADGLGTIGYQWLRAGNVISGATASSYQLSASDVGQSVSVRASYIDGQGTLETKSSAGVTPIALLEPGVVFANAGLGQLVTTEAGGTDSFTVALRVAPRHDVKLTFTISDTSEAVFDASGKATHSVTFTAANWSQAQTVMLRGVDDKPEDGDVAYTISTSVSSSDLRYDGMRSGQGLSIANITVTNQDDDASDEQYGDQGGPASADLIQGGNGASDLYGLLGRDEMHGNNGDDRLYGGYGDDVLYGNADDDELEGEQGNDKLDGGTGQDTLNGGTGNDSLYGQAGNDNLLGEAGRDSLLGGNGNDTLNGGADADNMDGGNGADVYYIDNAADVVRDSGTDTALDTVYIMSYLSGGITLGAGIDNGALNDLAGKGKLTGNTGNNALTGNAEENVILGGEGTDTLSGGAGADTLDGGTGNDTVDGGVGADSLTGGTGADSLAGGAGNDSLSGGVGDDVLYSGDGDDVVDAGDGADLIIGGDGAGNDKYNGGAGIDMVKYTSATAAITVNLGTGAASGTNIGKDTLSNIENLIGGKGGDSLTGSAVANKIEGDTGNDAIKGEAGNDTLVGGAGKDSLTGGAGNDLFDFNALDELGLGSAARDVITDFTVGQDKIDLATIDANTALAGDQAFKFVTSFTAAAGQVRYSQGIVYLNTDSDTATEYEIALTGVVPASLKATDFVL